MDLKDNTTTVNAYVLQRELSSGQQTMETNHEPPSLLKKTNRASGLSQTRPTNYVTHIEEDSLHDEVQNTTLAILPSPVAPASLAQIYCPSETARISSPFDENRFRVGYSPFEYNEKKELVLEELSKRSHQRRSVRGVWEALKSKGCHLEIDFVEKIVEVHRSSDSVQKHSWPPTENTDHDSNLNSNIPFNSSNIPSVHDWKAPETNEMAENPKEPRDITPTRDSLKALLGTLRVDVGTVTAIAPTPSSQQDVPPSLDPASRGICETNNTYRYDGLTGVLNHLLADLDRWCSVSLEDVAKAGSVPNQDIPHMDGYTPSSASTYPSRPSPYIPDWTVTEEAVASEAFQTAVSLQTALTQNSSDYLWMADKLSGLRGMLQDIGMPATCLAEIGLRHLQVIELVSQIYGRREWVLLELLQCAADCVYFLGSIRPVERHSGRRQSAAKKANDAAWDLASICPNQDFFFATSLHYTAIGLFETGEADKAGNTIKQSINLFSKRLSQDLSYGQALEMLRATLSYSRGPRSWARHRNTDAEAVLDHVLLNNLTALIEPARAELITEFARAVLLDDNPRVPWLALLLRATAEFQPLRSIVQVRPTRGQPVLTRLLKARADGLRYNDRFAEARKALEEAITIQRMLSALGDVDEAVHLVVLMNAYVENELHLTRREFLHAASMSASALFEEVTSIFGYQTPPNLSDCLGNLGDYLQYIRNPLVLKVLCGLVDIVHAIHKSGQTATLIPVVIRIILVISDLQRGLGAFDAALTTSREAMAIVTELNGDAIPRETYIDVLLCHSHSLIDNDSHEEASTHLTEVELIWEQSPSLKHYYPDSWTTWVALFSVVLTHGHERGRALSYIKIAIHASCTLVEYSSPAVDVLPAWLCSVPGYSEGGITFAPAWLWLLQAILQFNEFPQEAICSAEESLSLMNDYHQHANEATEPYVKVSLLEHEYLLLCFLHDGEARSLLLDEIANLYHSIFSTEPHRARLSLLVFLDTIITLSHELPSMAEVGAQLHVWKNYIYRGSMSFFEEFMDFLRNLPRYIHMPFATSQSGTLLSDEPSGSHASVARNGTQKVFFHPGNTSEPTSFPKSDPEVSVDLSGKTVRFSNQQADSSVKTAAPRPKFNIGRIPNLTGRIRIIKGPLCAGGFCDIYSGELSSERGTEPVAMKMLRVFNTEAHVVQAKKKFRREVNLWCSLRHQYVLPFFGTCEFDEFRLFMVSPWAEGGNSLDYIRRNPSADRGRLLWQTSSALAYLHSGQDAPQVVHGDLKADNVLISARGDALLCDFGLSRHVEEIVSKSGSSSAGRAGGHARFMAPELLLPPEDSSQMTRPTRASDVFAFASLMLQIYTEKLPFGDLLEAQAILKLASGAVPPRPVDPLVLERGCDHRFWTLMTECWRFKPSMRPTMEEIERRMCALISTPL